MKFTCINIHGNLISEEILQKIQDGSAEGQSHSFYGLENQSQLRSEIEFAWSKVKLEWKHFAERSQSLPSSDPYGTTLVRRLMTGFFGCIGFDLILQKTNLEGTNGKTYNISHTAENLDHLPVLITGFFDPEHPVKNTLDIRSSGGASRLSPHATIQEYLNVTEHLYGMATNGHTLRLMRDSGRLIKLTYIEFDLKRLVEEDIYSEFTLLYRMLHATRFSRTRQETEKCLIEKYYQESIETGNRIRDGLSNAVKFSLNALGMGFIGHPANDELRLLLKSGKLTPKDFFRELMRLVYRLLFLMVTEERDLIYNPLDHLEETQHKRKIYLKYYSISRLRKLSENKYLFERGFTDLWEGLMLTFRLFEAGGTGHKLGISPLGGDLFSSRALEHLESCKISNDLLLVSIRNLNLFEDETKNLVSINYRTLGTEELGSVYEGLLDLHPIVGTENAFQLVGGTDRKTTGSYYTRPELVNELIKSALIPVIEERIKITGKPGDILKEKKETSLLSLKICDPACGSGHFLLAASRTIAYYLAIIRTEEDNPSPTAINDAVRDVIQHCIYGIDLNPDAVELCKLALWIEGHSSGKPLSFLDHRIRHGNSLVGVTDLAVLEKGIPDEAYDPCTGDDKKVCQALKKENKKQRTGQLSFSYSASGEIKEEKKQLAGEFRKIDEIVDDSIDSYKEKLSRFHKFRNNPALFAEEQACNLWTAAFFHTYSAGEDKLIPTTERLHRFRKKLDGDFNLSVSKASATALENQFFHWPLEFPDVFEQGGFDVMLGNPPWERIKLQEQEFFATRDVEIANAANKAARDRLIKTLAASKPELSKEFEKALHTADAQGKFIRSGGRFGLTSRGDINTYSIFAELFLSIISKQGRAGIIVPTGIATDDSNKEFFSNLIEKNQLVSLFDFENREKLFPDVDSRYKFSLSTISGRKLPSGYKAQFAFFCTRVAHLQDKLRVFSLSSNDFQRLNPNTLTCPIFRTSVDAEITTKIYSRVPIFINEKTGENPWGVRFMAMFHMANDSHLFKTKQELEAMGLSLRGIHYCNEIEEYRPLYEAKMIWHFDHRFGTYEGIDSRTSTQTPTPRIEDYQNPEYQTMPWYWVNRKEIQSNLVKTDSDGNVLWQWNRNWLLGWRDITNSTNERTMVSSFCPLTSTGDTYLLMFSKLYSTDIICLNACLNSIPFDFVVKQKIGGVHLKYHVTKQLPILNPEAFIDSKSKIVSLVCELVYNSWDIKGLIDDVWKDSNKLIKESIQKQWNENQKTTGGNSWTPPGCVEIDPEGFPLPPFKWDEDRRAVLRAELDVIYAKLYGLTDEELRYILDPQDVFGPDFPGETFRVLKEKEIRKYGEYRTKRLVLEAWERIK